MSQEKPTLLSFKLCPFVQRCVIVFEEKQTPYALQYVDLQQKPGWFRQISPLSKVPLLKIGPHLLFESSVICEYIEETTPGPALHPKDPLQRAHNRAWIEVLSELTRQVHRLATAPDEAAGRAAANHCQVTLAELERQLEIGPLFNGPDFSLVDAAAAPALQRISWIDELATDLRLFDEVPKIGAWRDTLLARPSVQRSTVADLHDLFLERLRGGQSPDADRPSWLVAR